MGFRPFDAAPLPPCIQAEQGLGDSAATEGQRTGQGPQTQAAEPGRGRRGAGQDAGLREGREAMGTAQNSLSPAGEDLNSRLLPRLGPLLIALFIKPGPTGFVKPAAPSRGGLGGKMAPV